MSKFIMKGKVPESVVKDIFRRMKVKVISIVYEDDVTVVEYKC